MTRRLRQRATVNGVTAQRAGRHPALFAAACAVVLATYNNAVSRLPGHGRLYVPLNLTAAGLLLAAARRQGLSSAELGFGPGAVTRGVRAGTPAAGLIATGYLVALRTPARALLRDQRFAGVAGARLAYEASVRIPLGTVLWEEIAFRGVLLGALRRMLSVHQAVAVDSLVFGIWHIRPTRDAVSINRPEIAPARASLLVTGGIASTAFAGALLCRLRLHSRSLLAPMLLHLSANSLGVLSSAAASGGVHALGTTGRTIRREDRRAAPYGV